MQDTKNLIAFPKYTGAALVMVDIAAFYLKNKVFL